MYTEKEYEAVKLSPTKKDFYQIWNELLDTAEKLSDIWFPKNTNEADPGIVLLKVLTAIADKLNYTIDKNTLEAFMPSATQEESVRKLCDMLGYRMKYYRSAETQVTISYTGATSLDANTKNFIIPKGTYITNKDNNITYCIIDEGTIFNDSITSKAINAIEGELIPKSFSEDSIITMSNLDDNFKYYLPENQVAENGIFVYNTGIISEDDTVGDIGVRWELVDNLNSQPVGAHCFKFGYDSRKRRAYIQFPNYIGNIIGNGLFIQYIRTRGVNGNIAAKTLCKLQNTSDIIISQGWEGMSKEELAKNLTVTNASATFTGTDKETIDEAYNNYKKTIGTFDTLVTCRDYMNKIYQLTETDIEYNGLLNTTPLVSNIIVGDLRDDINGSVNVCTLNEYGLVYKNIPRSVGVEEAAKPKLNHFDIVLYPFKRINNLLNKQSTTNATALKEEYDNSFKYDEVIVDDLEYALEKYKTISHNIKRPDRDDLVCIKNKLSLNATITTKYKVTVAEEDAILNNIFAAIYKKFNMRMLEFGEEIPYDEILSTIQLADTRIKNVILNEPQLETVYLTGNNLEIKAAASGASTSSEFNALQNSMIIQNVLAGRVELFNYDRTFTNNYSEEGKNIGGLGAQTNITGIEGKLNVNDDILKTSEGVTLTDNQVIKFDTVNYVASHTFGAYTYYATKLNTDRELTDSEGNLVIEHNIKREIPANTEYKLGQNEYLYFFYKTNANEDSDNSEKIAKYICYGEGTCIRPNFTLINTETDGGGGNARRYAKVKGVDYPADTKFKLQGSNETVDAPKGMYGCGPTEQIEIINPNTVVLGSRDSSNIIKVYFSLNNETPELDGNIKFPTTPYILKDGEYFFYTDTNELDMVYYGANTEVNISGNLRISKKPENKIDLERILEDGLAAGIEWISCSVNDTNAITVTEHKTFTATSGDTVSNVEFKDDKIITAKIKQKDGTIINLPDTLASWNMNKYLCINSGPNKSQKINDKDEVIIYYGTNEHQTLDKDTSFKLALPIMTDGNKETFAVGIPIKFFTDKSSEQIENKMDTAPFGQNWTKLSGSMNSKYKIYTTIPNNTFGIISFFVDDTENSSTSSLASLEATSEVIKIYNGEDGGYGKSINLEKGLTTIEVKESCGISITANAKIAIILGNLNIVDKIEQINPNLGYKPNAESEVRKDKEIYTEIEKLLTGTDVKFYYDAPIDNSLVINLNPFAGDKLTDPIQLYDYNNIYNKFVISEIDSSYLKNGIKIARDSKL